MINALNMCFYSSYDRYNKINRVKGNTMFKYLNQAFVCSFFSFISFIQLIFILEGIFTQTEK